MPQLPPLSSAPINLEKLRKQSQDELVAALDSMPGKKQLVLDPKLSGPLALIAQPALLKEHGVEDLKYLGTTHAHSEWKNVIYFVRPRLDLIKLISAHIQFHIRQKQQKLYSIFFTPRRSIVCEKVLEEEGVREAVTISEFPLFSIPFDDDLLSLENELAFKEPQVDGDTTSLWTLARTINKLQSIYGIIPNIKGKGKAAAQVYNILMRMQKEQMPATPVTGHPEIDTLILLDRQVDMITPMCVQLTYEGLIDEFIGINNGAVELDPQILGQEKVNNKNLKVPLNSNDKLYREIRDMNFWAVGKVLQEKAVSMKEDYTDVKTKEDISDLKKFVKKMNSLPEMTRHVHLSQYITTFTDKPSFTNKLSIEQTLVEGQNYVACYDYIEELICKQEPLIKVMRLLVMLSVTNNGLQKKHFDYFRREILHSYGFEHMFFLTNLEKAGLFKRQETKTNWQAIKKGLNLVADGDDQKPEDISYVFSGYAPLSVRLVQRALTDGWRSIDEVMKLLPGPTFERRQGSHSRSMDNLNDSSLSYASDCVSGDGRRALALVVFVGGVTFAEVAALRFLSSKEFTKHDVMILTTKLINGDSLLKTLQQNPCESHIL